MHSLAITVDSEIFMRILFSQIALKDILVSEKFVTKARFTYINIRQGDFMRVLCSRNFAYAKFRENTKSLRKFPNLQ